MAKPVSSAFSVEGEGPALFMIHGIGASRHTWDGVVRALRSQYRCIYYDLRGHGRSPLTATPFTLDDLVDDLEALRAELGVGRAHFIGHSLGGMIGPAYARRYPQHVESLGLLSTAAGRTPEDSARVKAVIAAMEQNGIPQVLETLKERWFTPEFGQRHPEIIANRLKQVVDTDAGIFLNVFRIYAETEMAPWLKEIAAPALVLTGEFDGGCPPRLNEFIARQLPRAELVILPGLRHSILLEASDRVAAPVLDFLNRHGAKRA